MAPRSPLGKTIARVLASARSGGDTARWSTALGTLLLWSDRHGIDASELWAGGIDVFRRDYMASGRTSPGEYLRVARRLVRELSQRRTTLTADRPPSTATCTSFEQADRHVS